MWLFAAKSAEGQEAPSLPSPKSGREFKHKPLCERMFYLSVIHFSVGLPSQTPGVLLAFKLALYPLEGQMA